jgi:5'-methylthioadenosine phosphorylase
MTQYPECYLAREFGLCYVATAMITDYDVGVGRRRISFGTDTSLRPVLDVFDRNVAALKNPSGRHGSPPPPRRFLRL